MPSWWQHFFFKRQETRTTIKTKTHSKLQSKRKFMRAEWVIYLGVRNIGIKIPFYRMSSPVLFMPWEQWHMVRIIISVKTNLFTCRGASLFILLMNLSHSYAIYALSAVSQRGWFLKREYWFELKYSHILHFYLMRTPSGFLPFLQGSFTLS